MLPLVLRRPITAGLIAALLGLGGLAVGALALPGTVLGAGPLPACAYKDVLTTPRAYSDWSTTLVDTILRVPATYIPPDLVPVSQAGIGGTGQVRAIVIDDLAAMTTAAAAAGSPIAVQSAYRSYVMQITTFQYWVNLDGYTKALGYSARPGHSEHQLGVAIDFKSAAGGPPWSGSDWGQSPAGSWMRLNAWKYGFILSYPKGKASITCYDYESWHYRYVGRTEAAAIHASGLTIRQYLWAHFTTVVLPGTSPASTATPPPSRTASPSASPSAVPTSSPRGTPAATAAGPSPVAPSSPPPIDAPTGPATVFLGMDVATTAVAGGLVALVLLLVGSLAMAVRRHGRSGPS